MNKFTRFTAVKALLHKSGFRSNRWPDLLDSPRRADGFLRVVVHEGDDRVELVRFTANSVIMWKLSLSIHLPEAVFDAALRAAFSEVGVKPKLFRAKLNGRPVMVTIPE